MNIKGSIVPKSHPEDKRAKGLASVPSKSNAALQNGATVKDTLGKGQGETGPVDVRG